MRQPLRGAARGGVPDARRGLGGRSRPRRAARGERAPAGARRPRALRAPGGHADGTDAAMSAGDVLLWIIVPYVAVTVFVVGHWWRYRTDQFAWTSRSTQL